MPESELANRLSGEGEHDGVVSHAIKDRIGLGGIFYQLMEGIGRKLRGDHRRGDVDTLIENLQQFPGVRNGDRAKAEIIEHEQIHLAIV